MSETPNVYVLNLNRHPDRLEEMQKQLNSLGVNWERIEAVDALEASEEELDKYIDAFGPISRMGSGARACTVGHFKIWEKFLDTGKPIAFILEDDVKISHHFSMFIDEASKLADDVDILNFNRQNSRRAQKKLVVSKIGSVDGAYFAALRLLGPHYGTAGYMITRATALHLVNTIKRTNVPIDHLLFNPNVSSFSRTSRIYQTFPAMVEPDTANFQTSIQREVIHGSGNWRNKLTRGYYETNRIPAIMLQLLLNRAAIRVLTFRK